MPLIVIGIIALLAWAFVPFRLVLKQPLTCVRYVCSDVYWYIKEKKYNVCRTGELVAYVGLFGKGKTLSAVNYVCEAYRKYNDKEIWDRSRMKFVTQQIKIISNVHLTQVPYEHFVSLEQVVYAAESNKIKDAENDTLTVTLVLGDEFSVQLNSRDFKKNIDPLFLNTILTCRHHLISLFYTAQRFAHVDALLRQVTCAVVSCNKLWRFQRKFEYDAWEMENATNPDMLKPMHRGGFFVLDRDYNAYDTLACVGNLKKSFADGDMITEDQILALQRNEGTNLDAVVNPSRKLSKARKRANR